MDKLLICPCGKIPEELNVLYAGQGTKWANVSGNCCGEWMIEFRSNYNAFDSAECIDLAVAAWNDAPREQSGWQPIETAPKDGSHIMLYRPIGQFVGYYGGDFSGWRINAPGLPAMCPPPTHWKPLSRGPGNSNS